MEESFPYQVMGTTVAIGAHGEDSNTTSILHNGSLPTAGADDDSAGVSGAVYVYRYSGSAWQEEAYIKASNSEAGIQFNRNSLNEDGTKLIVGAQRDKKLWGGINPTVDIGSNTKVGAFYVYEFDSTWSESAYVKNSFNPRGADWFGEVVKISGMVKRSQLALHMMSQLMVV